MENPYEENTDFQSAVESVQLPSNLNINVNTDPVQTLETPQESELLADNSAVTSTGGSSVVNLNTREGRKQMWAERREFSKLPEGSPERTQAENAWALKYQGKTWDEYQAEEQQKRSFTSALQRHSAVFNPNTQGAMMAPVVGTGDFIADTGSLITKKFGFRIPKIGNFENQGHQALREVSSLIIPFFILKGKAMSGGAAIHKSGAAGAWLQRLGNNPVFKRFATIGLDLGVGAAVDGTVETNKVNDTLATSWKRGRWWGHGLIPERWTSDGLGPDEKHRANVLEGMRLGFYTSLAEGFVKLYKAGRGTTKTTKFLAEKAGVQKQLDELTQDPIRNTKYSDDPVEQALTVQEKIHERELKELGKFHLEKGEKLTKPTVGVHKFQNELEAGLVAKNGGVQNLYADQARIVGNKGTTNGRLSTVLSNAERLKGTQPEDVLNRTILKRLKNDLLKGGPYSVEGQWGKLTKVEMEREAEILAELLASPTLKRGDLVQVLDQFKELKNGVKTVNPVAYKALNKASKKYLDMWSDITNHKNRALLLTSEAGGISDLSEASRLSKDTDAIQRVNDQILERLELFEIESSIADFEWGARGAAFNELKALNHGENATEILKRINKLNDNYTQKLTDIIPKAKRFRKTLELIQNEAPEFAETIRLAYELSDGNIQSIKALNKYIENQFGTYSKMFVDSNPAVPSMFNKALMTNIFNSMLSAIGTPVRALQGNFGGFIAEPLTVMYGALRSGDAVQMRRAAHMYFGITDTLQNGFGYMGKVFRKASETPDELATMFRKDYALEKAQGRELAKEFAAAASRIGEDGPQSLLNVVEELDAMGRDPVLRFGPNAMTGLDGFTEATQKIAFDKGKAFDLLMEKYPNGNWGKNEFQDLWKEIHKQGWTEDGLISDSAVEWSRREIALNLDTPLTKLLNPIIKRFPPLRSLFWFPTTQMNALDMFGKYGNVSRVKIGTDFAGDYAELLGPYGNRAADDFDPAEIQKILAKRGMDMSGDYMAKFKHLRNKVRGRVAMGNMAVMGAWLMVSQDRIRGNGHWDKGIHNNRLTQGWKPLTYQGLDGKWHSYEWMGPIAKWLGLTVDVFDNFNSMSTTRMEKMGKKLSFVLAASVNKQSLLGSMEPLFAVLGGNAAARSRWIGQMTNSIFPLAGFRNELGKNMYGTLREVENEDIGEIIRNRNNWIDAFDDQGKLSEVVNWVDGKPISIGTGSWWSRVKNNSLGLKTSEKPSPEGQFLIDIEFDAEPHLNVSSSGVKYTKGEITELGTLIGEDGYAKTAIQRAMSEAEKVTYTDPDTNKVIKGYRNIMLYARSKGLTSEDLSDFEGIRKRLSINIQRARNRVENLLSTRDRINKEAIEKRVKATKSSQGDINAIINLKHGK